MSDVSAPAEGSNLLSTIAPGTPTPFPFRSSSVMLFSCSEASGIPQNSVIAACSSTTLARWLAASPVMSLWPTLCVRGAGDVREVHDALPQSVLSCQWALTKKQTTLEHYWQIYWASYWNYTSKRFTGPVNPVTGSNVDTGPVNRQYQRFTGPVSTVYWASINITASNSVDLSPSPTACTANTFA